MAQVKDNPMLPKEMIRQPFGPFGFEKDIRRRLEWWAKKRADRRGEKGEPQDESS